MECGHRSHVTQRVTNARKDIINRYLSGMPIIIPDIAKTNKVGLSYTYKLLQSIADELGIKREELLRYPKSFFVKGSCLTTPEKADISRIQGDIQKTISLARNLIAQIDEVLAQE